MSHQPVTDAQRTAIEDTIRALNKELFAAAEQVDADLAFASFTDEHNAGFINVGVFYPSLDSFVADFRDDFGRSQGQEIEVSETRVSVLASNAAVLATHGSFIATFKEGGTFESPFACTFVYAKVEEDWKVVHAHQSFPLPE